MSVISVNDGNFTAEVESCDLPVLVDFSATWCMPCQRLAPTVHEIAGETAGRYKVCNVDVDHAPGLARRFEIMCVPTLLVMRGGRVIVRMEGGQSKEQLLAALSRAERA